MAMQSCDNSSGLRGIVGEVLRTAVHGSRPTTVSSTREARVESLANLDYAQGLNRCFSPRELQSLIKGLRLSLPDLNREQFKWHGFQDLSERASQLGARLVATPLSGCEGKSLLGFYLKEGSARNAPLICLNSAHHPAAMSAAFFHELGHHLTARLFAKDDESLCYSFKPEYERHLDEPTELLADILVCLEAYPKSAARQILRGYGPKQASVSAGDLSVEALVKAEGHLANIGLELKSSHLVAEDLHYLIGMIHFMKLRQALYRGYDL
jgi:hypothetical protein